jgi:carbamoylphosphate synthase large subunit
MAKVLLADTNFSSGPIFSELQNLGHEVHVVGRKPDDCLAMASRYYWEIDYSDTTELKRLVERENFDYIVPGCTDRSYTSCSVVNEGQFLGIEAPEIDRVLNNKEYFRELALSLDLPVPAVQKFPEISLRWPLIVKPVDSFSGKGITVIEREDENLLEAAISLAHEVSPSKKYLIEEFVRGQLYSHSAFLKKNKIIKDFIVQEDSTVNPFVVDTSRVVFKPDNRMLAQMRAAIEKLAKALQLKDGLIHTQFIADGSNVWLIEITRRCPGDLYSQLIELSTGFPFAKAYVAGFLENDVVEAGTPTDWKNIIRHTITVPDEHFFSHIKFNQPVHVERFITLALSGTRLEPSPRSRLGILFLKEKSLEDWNATYEAILDKKIYTIASF